VLKGFKEIRSTKSKEKLLFSFSFSSVLCRTYIVFFILINFCFKCKVIIVIYTLLFNLSYFPLHSNSDYLSYYDLDILRTLRIHPTSVCYHPLRCKSLCYYLVLYFTDIS
jgi:hypothetical protein